MCEIVDIAKSVKLWNPDPPFGIVTLNVDLTLSIERPRLKFYYLFALPIRRLVGTRH